MRLGTGSRGKDASNRNIGGTVGSVVYPEGKPEDLTGADALIVRGTSLAIPWGFEVRKREREGER